MKALSRFLSFLLICSLPWSEAYGAHKRARGPDPKLYAALVMNVKTGKVIYQENAFLSRKPASLTKLMTSYLVFDRLKRKVWSPEDQVKISCYAAKQEPTKLGIKAGHSLKVKDALITMIVKSCNDTATALGEKIMPHPKKLAALMTQRARSLGLQSTVFANPSGLPHPQQRTTAYDMALLGRALLLHFPQYAPLFSVKGYEWNDQYFSNTNKLLGPVPNHPDWMIRGLKTGMTYSSGFHLMTWVCHKDEQWIVLVMGMPDRHMRSQYVMGIVQKLIDRKTKKRTKRTKPFSHGKHRYPHPPR